MAGNLSPKLPWELANPKWAATLNPFLNNPLLNGRFLDDVPVLTGTNIINHGLSRNLVGWIVTRNDAAATFYDSQAINQRQAQTLILEASADALISLYVF